MKPIRLAVVISHPTQHFFPVYVELAKRPEIDLKVFYIVENGVQESLDAQFGVKVQWDTPMLEGYEYEFIEPGKIATNFGFFDIDSTVLVSKMNSFDPDCLWVHGYAQRANWRALRGMKKHVRTIYSSDSNASIVSPKWKQWIKGFVITSFFKRIDAFLSVSPSNYRYLTLFGAKKEMIFETSFPIDTERLSAQREDLTADSAKALKGELSIPNTSKVLLVVGKLLGRKRVRDVVEALAHLHDDSVHLLVVGSGECHSQLLDLAKRNGLSERVHITGFINQGKLPAYFDIADVLVFPSENEPYGAVVSEALVFGLPIVIASGIGAIGASAVEGKNSLVYRVSDVRDLAEKLNRLLASPLLLEDYAKQSLSMAQAHDKRIMATDIVRICRNAV